MLDVAGHPVSLLAVVALGVGVGYVAGMFGVGGGFMLTPMLHVALGVPLPIAVGTGLCQMVGTALAALLRHRRVGQGEIRFDLLMLPGSVVGVDAGARALAALSRMGEVHLWGRSVPTVILVAQLSYAALFLTVAVVFWIQGRAPGAHLSPRPGPLVRFRLGPRVDLPSASLRSVSAILIAYLGLASGFLSGLLGIGGGVALMPVLIYGFGFSIRQAAGTGIFVLFCSAVAGTMVHGLRGNVHLGLAMAILVGSSLSAQAGALATRRLPPPVLKKSFALVILLAVAAIVFDLWRRLA